MNSTTIMNLVVAVSMTLGIDGCCCKPENQQRKMERETAAATTTGAQDEPAAVKPPKDGTIEVAAAVSPSKLYQDYDSNEVRADARYKGKRLAVAGNIESIDKDFLDNVVLKLKAGSGFMQSVHATLEDTEKGKVASMDKGDKVYLICVGGTRIMKTPTLDDCVVASESTKVRVKK